MEVGNSSKFGAELNPRGTFDPCRTEEVTYIDGPGTRVRAHRARRARAEAAKFEEETEPFCFPVIHLHSE